MTAKQSQFNTRPGKLEDFLNMTGTSSSEEESSLRLAKSEAEIAVCWCRQSFWNPDELSTKPPRKLFYRMLTEYSHKGLVALICVLDNQQELITRKGVASLKLDHQKAQMATMPLMEEQVSPAIEDLAYFSEGLYLGNDPRTMDIVESCMKVINVDGLKQFRKNPLLSNSDNNHGLRKTSCFGDDGNEDDISEIPRMYHSHRQKAPLDTSWLSSNSIMHRQVDRRGHMNVSGLLEGKMHHGNQELGKTGIIYSQEIDCYVDDVHCGKTSDLCVRNEKFTAQNLSSNHYLVLVRGGDRNMTCRSRRMCNSDFLVDLTVIGVCQRKTAVCAYMNETPMFINVFLSEQNPDDVMCVLTSEACKEDSYLTCRMAFYMYVKTMRVTKFDYDLSEKRLACMILAASDFSHFMRNSQECKSNVSVNNCSQSNLYKRDFLTELGRHKRSIKEMCQRGKIAYPTYDASGDDVKAEDKQDIFIAIRFLKRSVPEEDVMEEFRMMEVHGKRPEVFPARGREKEIRSLVVHQSNLTDMKIILKTGELVFVDAEQVDDVCDQIYVVAESFGQCSVSVCFNGQEEIKDRGQKIAEPAMPVTNYLRKLKPGKSHMKTL